MGSENLRSPRGLYIAVFILLMFELKFLHFPTDLSIYNKAYHFCLDIFSVSKNRYLRADVGLF